MSDNTSTDDYVEEPDTETESSPDETAPTPEELFGVEDHIFRIKELVEIGHVPKSDRIVGRNEEIKELVEHIRDAIRGDSPEHVLIYGETGTGKTLVSRYVTNHAQQLTEGVSLGVCYIDCSDADTETKAARELAMKLNDESTGIDIPFSGFGADRYYRYLWKDIFEKLYDVVIVIFDEIDRMRNDDILMKLSRARENKKTDARIGVIGISNKIHYPETFNERVKSSLDPQEMNFSPYDANQLRQILFNREEAFHDGVLTDDVIPLIAALSAQEHGDARKAINMFRYAGKLARKNNDPQVMEEHVRKAQKLAEKDRFKTILGDVTTQTKLALLGLAELTVTHEESWFMTSKIFDQYKDIAQKIDAEVLSMRRMRDILHNQAFIGILETEKISKGVKGGVYNNHRLVDDAEIVRETLLEDSRLHDWDRPPRDSL